MKLTTEQRDKFDEHGYIIIDNFLPDDIYDELIYDLKARRSMPQYQIRPNHYSHVFKSEMTTLPREEEAYIAKFSLLKGSVDSDVLEHVFQRYLMPTMEDACPGIKYSLFPSAVRLRSGDVYRTHQDSYAGIVGYSFFVNDGWCWDYGGILTYVRENQLAEMIYPRGNRLLLRNELFKHFNFLNTIEQFCSKEQYIISGWADSKKGDDSKVRGEYYEIGYEDPESKQYRETGI